MRFLAELTIFNRFLSCDLYFFVFTSIPLTETFKVHSDLEMSDFSSRVAVNEENSGCESDSEFEAPKENGKSKVRKKRKTHSQQQRDPVAMTSTQTDDETESQLNFGENPTSPVASPVTSHYQEKMRRRLQFFFMNPIEKWQAKRR